VNRDFVSFPVKDSETFKDKMLSWANQFNICCLLDNHHYKLPYHTQECLLGVGAIHTFKPGNDFFSSLTSFCNNHNDWIFGHFSYDLKNKIENLSSNHPDGVAFPEAFLFVPAIIIQLEGDNVSIGVGNDAAAEIFRQINEAPITGEDSSEVHFVPQIEKEEYIKIIEKLREHIKRGDCYEINFCQEFYSKNTSINPLFVYRNLVGLSPNPFSAFYRIDDKYVLCSSPERYIKKTGSSIISQPIKGTAQRDLADVQSDTYHKQGLVDSAKDRSENIMIVDLVRNDLSKICKEATVEVENLYHVYTFPYVHQMISTIKGVLESGVDFSNVLQATFPMGSMTGAPKKKVMELIEQYEKTKRGIYSGTIGYITPEKDFDFNVVIRSLMYNATTKYLSYQVGGGITYNSDPEKEYQECLVKAAAIKQVL
jgi:para-aminobenzoate synthetase component 1